MKKKLLLIVLSILVIGVATVNMGVIAEENYDDSCEQNNDCVFAINTSSCCTVCSFITNQDTVNTNEEIVIPVAGTDYSSFPKSGNCTGIDCVQDCLSRNTLTCENNVCIGSFVEEPSCNSDNLDLCLDETNCTDAGGFWYDDTCNAEEEATCDPENLNLCEDEETCEAEGGEWNNDTLTCESEDDDETDEIKVCCKRVHYRDGKTRYNHIDEISCVNSDAFEATAVEENLCEDKNKLMREFNARDGSRIVVNRTVEIVDGKRVIKIVKKIVKPDGIEIEVKIKIIEKIENGVLKNVLKVEGEEEEIETELEIDEDETNDEDSELLAQLSNGKKAKIKILPARAHAIAREKLKAGSFDIELIEVTERGIHKAVYQAETNKNGRFLGIFKLKVKIEGEIDPETGEFLGTNKPWWAFLVSGEDSDQTNETE